ncbi:MAG: hypothetical protein DMF87_23195 [Acidobacteria bacterium]|nr:MAG: hypothetical protein DMF87_23195 [Acidobacteriota bacterium]
MAGDALVVDVTSALPHEVRRRVLVVARVERIHLDAARVDEQVIRLLACARGIEADRDPVVVPRVVAPGDRRPDLVRLLV